jgi:hypothetical protein
MTHYDRFLPAANKIVRGLAGKPGVHFANREMVANRLAQQLSANSKNDRLLAACKRMIARIDGVKDDDDLMACRKDMAEAIAEAEGQQ